MSYKAWRDFKIPDSTVLPGSIGCSTALEPIVIYIPRCGAASTVVEYRLVVGTQWCSRHPHDVMLRSTQKQHPATSPDLWHRAVSAIKDKAPEVGDHLAGAAMDYLGKQLKQMVSGGGNALMDRIPLVVD
jgi:hypothetical protein